VPETAGGVGCCGDTLCKLVASGIAEALSLAVDLIDRLGEVPVRVWQPPAISGRALRHQRVLRVSQAVFNRIAGGSQERREVGRAAGHPLHHHGKAEGR
jgi:hypothetical protein